MGPVLCLHGKIDLEGKSSLPAAVIPASFVFALSTILLAKTLLFAFVFAPSVPSRFERALLAHKHNYMVFFFVAFRQSNGKQYVGQTIVVITLRRCCKKIETGYHEWRIEHDSPIPLPPPPPYSIVFQHLKFHFTQRIRFTCFLLYFYPAHPLLPISPYTINVSP